jgi:uncharacterized protein with GYD domain
MSSYVMLFNFTARGVENIDESPSRVDAARRVTKELGGEVKQFYGLMGRYDTLFILEAPSDETAAKIAAAIGKQGNVRCETLRAFSEAEYKQILSGLPGKR